MEISKLKNSRKKYCVCLSYYINTVSGFARWAEMWLYYSWLSYMHMMDVEVSRLLILLIFQLASQQWWSTKCHGLYGGKCISLWEKLDCIKGKWFYGSICWDFQLVNFIIRPAVVAMHARTVWPDQVDRPDSVHSGKFTAIMVTNKKQKIPVNLQH